MPRLVACDSREPSIETSVGEALLAHRLQLKPLPGEGDGRLDHDVVQRHPLDESVEILRVAGQPLGGGGEPLIEEGVVALVRLGPDLSEQLGQVFGLGTHDVMPPALEEHCVARLIDHLSR